jgi:hypothetical protein
LLYVQFRQVVPAHLEAVGVEVTNVPSLRASQKLDGRKPEENVEFVEKKVSIELQDIEFSVCFLVGPIWVLNSVCARDGNKGKQSCLTLLRITGGIGERSQLQILDANSPAVTFSAVLS